MELTPLVPAGKQIIERYAPSGFRISGTVYTGPVLVFPDRTIEWEGGALSMAALAPVIAHGEVELLLIGTGRRMTPIAATLRQEMRALGIGIDTMDTGAACRTFNVLLGEDRRLAAALLPPV